MSGAAQLETQSPQSLANATALVKFVFEEQGQVFLFYSICGEQGIAAATSRFANDAADVLPPPSL